MQVGRERPWGKSTLTMASSLELFPAIFASIVAQIIRLSLHPCNSSNLSGMRVSVAARQTLPGSVQIREHCRGRKLAHIEVIVTVAMFHVTSGTVYSL